MEVLDKNIDVLFMKFLANHFAGEDSRMFAGPDTGANNPVFFYTVEDMPKKYPGLKKVLEIIRSTAGLYNSPNRSLIGVEKAWCVAMDFDYDRGDWAGKKRSVQDTTLYEFCEWISPTAAVRTGNGWHLYWVLDKPMSAFDYAYPASLFKASIKADTRSILPMQCLNFYSRSSRKPAVMVDTMVFESIGKAIPVFPNRTYYYRVSDLKVALGKCESKELQKLRQNMYQKFRPTDDSFYARRMKVKDEAMAIIESVDVVGALNSAGYRAYGRAGGRVICCCPFHDDRHPSAYLDINPNSDYFGMFFCTSTSCHKTATLKQVMEHIGAVW